MERYLADEPVQARMASAAYRLRKFARRNRAGVAVAGLVVSAVIALAIGATFVVRDRTARLTAVRQQVSEALAGARAAIEAGDLKLADLRVAAASGHLGDERQRLTAEAAATELLRQEIADREADADRYHRFLRLSADAQTEMSLIGDIINTCQTAEDALGIFGVLADDAWLSRLDGSHLTPAQKGHVRETAYVILVYLADNLVRWDFAAEDAPAAVRGLDLLRRAEAFHKPTRAYFFVRSECHRRMKDKASADADKQRYLQAQAESAWDHFLPGHTAGWNGDLDEAIRAYRAALAVQPDHFNSLYFLAARLTKKLEYREAIGLYTGCLALRPDHYWILASRAMCFEKLGDWNAAAEDFDTVVRRATDKQRHDKSWSLCTRARFFERHGDRRAAEADFAAAVACAKSDPDRASVLGVRGQVFEERGDWKAAEADLTSAIEHAKADPTSVNLYLARAQFFGRRGDGEAAKADYAAAAVRATTHGDRGGALARRAFLCKQLGQKGEADADVQRLVDDVTRLAASASGVHLAHLLHRRAHYYCWLGRYDRAIDDLSRAVELAPRRADYWAALGIAQVVSADTTAASVSVRRAMEQNPDDHEAYCTCAAALLLAGDGDGYRQTCDGVLARFGESKDPRKAYLIARTWTLAPVPAAEAERLVSVAQRAVDSGPKDRDCNLHALGMTLYRAGQYEQAKERFLQVEELNPEWDGRVCNWLALALAYHRLGKSAEARQWRDKAVSWIEAPTVKKPWLTPIGPSLEIHVHNWLAYRLLLREAEALLDGQK